MTTDTGESDIRSDLKLLLEIAVAIAGSGAFISALMVYFGWLRTRVLFDYFGIPVSILNYSTADYVLRSAEVFFKPAIWIILVAAGLAATYAVADRLERNESRPKQLRHIVRITFAVATAGCAAVGVLGLLELTKPITASILLCLSGALVVVQYAMYRTRTRTRTPTAMLVVGTLLALASVFWSVSIYAADIGEEVAANIAAGRLPRSNATIYSSTELGIAGREVAEYPSGPSNAGGRFIYTGYRLLTYTNQRWILIRQPWSAGSPTVILRDDDSLRVELAAP